MLARISHINTMQCWTSRNLLPVIVISAGLATTILTYRYESAATTFPQNIGWLTMVNLALGATSILTTGQMMGSIQHPNGSLNCHIDNEAPSATVTTENSQDIGFCCTGFCTALASLSSVPPYPSVFQLLAFVSAELCLKFSIFALGSHSRRPAATELLSTPASSDPLPRIAATRTQLQSQMRSGTIWTLCKWGFLVATGVSWVWIFVFASFPSLLSRHQGDAPRLDLDYVAPAKMDIVINMFEESPSTVASLIEELRTIPVIADRSPNFLVYLKDPLADPHEIHKASAATLVVVRPNRGREGETYLWHIINNWDQLAEQTLFLQAAVHNRREVYSRIHHYLVPTTGMLSLGFSGTTCDCSDCLDRWGWDDYSNSIPAVYEEVYNASCVGPVLLSYKGQFVASAARIRGNKRAFYENLWHAMIDPTSWAHAEKYLQGRPDSLDAPFFGYTLERIWSTIMQCSDIDVAARCPTLLSRWRRWGATRDCQCVDV